MVDNAFEALVLQVNQKISEMDTAISKANAAAAQAQTSVGKVDAAVAKADKAIEEAEAATQEIIEDAKVWDGVTVSATTVEAGGAASAELTEVNGKKHFAFGIVKGEKGATGPQGPSGKGGVSFRKSGTILYIETT